jgi:hypothetical protein
LHCAFWLFSCFSEIARPFALRFLVVFLLHAMCLTVLLPAIVEVKAAAAVSNTQGWPVLHGHFAELRRV